MKALDYCVFKNRHDMAVVLQEFVESSQQIINIKSYELVSDYRTDSRNIQSTDAFRQMLQLDPDSQYKRVLASSYLTKTQGLSMTKSLRK